MSEGTFICDNCHQQFPNEFALKVRPQTSGPTEREPVRTFHSPECADEFQRKLAGAED